MKCPVHHRKKFLWLIILHLSVDVHSCFAVFMPCKVLDSLGVNPGIQQVGDIGMPKLVEAENEGILVEAENRT